MLNLAVLPELVAVSCCRKNYKIKLTILLPFVHFPYSSLVVAVLGMYGMYGMPVGARRAVIGVLHVAAFFS